MLNSIKKRLKSTAWRLKPYKYTLLKWLINLRLLSGSDNFTKFAVITRSRTGSTLIDHSLRNHPNVISDGEILNWRFNRNIDWLIDNIYSVKHYKTKAVGFKIFYYHPQDDTSGEVWEKLKSIPELKIIHLKRKDRLATYLSRAIAGQTKVWSSSKGKGGESVKKIKLNPSEIEKDFEVTRNYEQTFDDMFADNPVLQVEYEDLLNDFSKAMHDIQCFLEVPYLPVQSRLKKQGKKSAQDKIENYVELVDYFSDTEWSSHFSKTNNLE